MTGAGAGAGALLVVGDVVTDVVAVHPEPLAPATDTAARIRTLPGGAGANAACWAACAGAPEVRLLARVGAESARWHERALVDAGVRPRLVIDPVEPTGTVVALVGKDTERTFLTDSGAALRLCPDDWAPALLDGAAHLHLSGYLFFADTSRELALVALRAARARGVPVSVDPASAGFLLTLGPRRFLDAVAGVDVLLPNEDEARLLAGLPERSGAARAAVELSRRVPLVVVTLGAAGALVAEAGRITAEVAGEAVRAVDSTGAGDAFTGGFLAARLAGADPAQAARAGCRTAAMAVTRLGGRP
ncbi:MULTISPECIES: carbohydrate kinase family protein [unclassified Streptomyces]|uniref:carbohydrate kinase family protein n=1 Tax=unclassified Streptomyces TaxID=2593676 RepID=UPI002259C36D|nr:MULTISPECIES: PfkB family carbohydrate kinase [unclassified Streptomyces]MCX4525304.1 PfkB family carbohydrate kinase [Streptomyces sp. NBC_01551]MCX4544221.1 PfkB family carbohydrate kinase [Streptomyces sp. NBC_01565]